MAPSDEGLGADHLGGAQVDEGLVMDLQVSDVAVVATQQLPDFAAEGEPAGDLHPHGRVEVQGSGAAGCLRRVHRHVCLREQVRQRRPVSRVRDADARAGLQREAVDQERRLQRVQKPVGQAVRIAAFGEDDELVTTEACDQTGLTDGAEQPVTQQEKHGVTDVVTVGVVDLLELVHVDEQQTSLRGR